MDVNERWQGDVLSLGMYYCNTTCIMYVNLTYRKRDERSVSKKILVNDVLIYMSK